MAIWAKTDAGRIEMQARALVKERAVRNLLLVIDGVKSEEMLLAHLAGIGPDHFVFLQRLGLIAPIGGHAPSAAYPSTVEHRAEAVVPSGPSDAAAPLDYAQFTTVLTQLISKELGLRGFMLTLAVEKASSTEELQDVARRTLEQIRERKSAAAEAAARRLLYGG